MCCLFGLADYGHSLSVRGRMQLLSALAAASEERGVDATGIAYNSGGRLRVYKRPLPAHRMRFRVPGDAHVIMGHTRMATQGEAARNRNNHPFRGRAGNTRFALAHNGVLWNDETLRWQYRLPATEIETDSYVAVQLLERDRELSFSSLGRMAEQLRGTFTFTVLDEDDRLFIVRGNSPFCLYHWPDRGLYLYASTEEILRGALKKVPVGSSKPEKIAINEGDILCIAKNGRITRSRFSTDKLAAPLWYFPRQQTNTEYIEDLKIVAPACGFTAGDIDGLLKRGFTPEEIEDWMFGEAMTCGCW